MTDAVASAPTRDARWRLLHVGLANKLRDYGILASVLGLFIVLSFASHAFLSRANLLNILEQNAPLGIIACGGTLVIIAGGFDLSVAAIFAVAGVVAAWVANHASPELGLLAGIASGLVCGLFNGFIVARLRINPFIATLGSGLVFVGVAQLITQGQLIIVNSSSFSDFGQGDIWSIKYSILIFAGVVLTSSFLLSRTRFGSGIYAVGGNTEAARLSGIRVVSVRMMTFVLSGLAASIAGVIAASRVATGQSDAGSGLELQAIAAVVIGGTSIAGGEGAVWRTVLGVFLLALINNGFNILNINPVWQGIVEGFIIMGAVAIDVWTRRSR